MRGLTRLSGGLINKDNKIKFTFNGELMKGFSGDTLGSALLANNKKLVARSFKYHRPRGIFSAGSEEPNALVTLLTEGTSEPNTRATVIELFEGLQAKTNTEEIEIALVLCNEHKAQNAEINAYLEDDELNEEFDDLCKQVEDQGYNNMDKFIKKHTNQEEAEQKYSEQKNEQIKKELSKEY